MQPPPPLQWGDEETRELIRIRAELERDGAGPGGKSLWEAASARMRRSGYLRSPDQCKCKWKNLLVRYKGKETADPESGRQCPFFDELHAVFVERSRNLQRQLLESEFGASTSRKKTRVSSGEDPSDDEEEEEGDSDNTRTTIRSRKRRADEKQRQHHQGSVADEVCSLLHEFLQQQQQMDAQWRATTERRARERLMLEQKWRHSMENLERERLMLEKAWLDREEQRRVREESRAEQRDAMLNSLLSRLLHDDQH